MKKNYSSASSSGPKDNEAYADDRDNSNQILSPKKSKSEARTRTRKRKRKPSAHKVERINDTRKFIRDFLNAGFILIPNTEESQLRNYERKAVGNSKGKLPSKAEISAALDKRISIFGNSDEYIKGLGVLDYPPTRRKATESIEVYRKATNIRWKNLVEHSSSIHWKGSFEVRKNLKRFVNEVPTPIGYKPAHEVC